MDFMISHFCDEENSQVFQTNGKTPCDSHALLGNEDTMESDENRLPPELELGNIEYKVKLINPSTSRLQHLITQMKWRLREGQGEAIYEVGVEDGGHLAGLSDTELTASMNTLKAMADALDASIVVLTERDVTPRGSTVRRRAIEVLVRRVPESQQFIELRLAILGGVDVGKSTMCGVLTQGMLDDGQGSARQNLFRYLHEVQTGKTSSICLDVIGFDTKGKLVNYSQHSLEEIVERSTKIVTLIDLAGDIKYLKTTIQGLSGYNAHYSCLLVSAETGPTAATREHLGLARALNIPVFVIITKKDAVDKPQLDTVFKQVTNLMIRAGIKEGVKRVKTKRDAVRACSAMSTVGLVPVLSISCVTGEGHKVLRCFLNVLPTHGLNAHRQTELATRLPLFTVEEMFSVPHVGTVACGMLTEGRLTEGESVMVGPAKDGRFYLASIDSIRRSKQPVRSVFPGEAASIAIRFKENGPPLRRGMVMISQEAKMQCCAHFTANLLLLYHTSNEICVGFQATAYIGAICQTVTIIDLDTPSMQPGVWTTAKFEFYTNPEYVRVGTPLIFRQGKTKGMGEIVKIHFD